MTKEELIVLSDLNREDNIKYISSEAQGIAIALDSDRYAPTLCKLERAYICGRRKSEEQIKEIENYFVESSGYGRDKVRNFMDIVNKALEQKGERITELEKELEAEKKLNAEIKARFVKCNTCTDDMKSKCLMFSENLCEGERCEELVDLMSLVSKSELEEQLTKAKDLLKRCYENYIYLEPLRSEIEQFLNSEVEK